MSKPLAVIVAVAFAAPFTTGCYGGAAAFHCDETHSCAGGTCEPVTGLCSVDDHTCSDPPRRYGELAGSLSNKCVGGGDGSGVDAGSGDGSGSGSGSPPDAMLFCYGAGTGVVNVCFAAPPTGTVNFNDTAVTLIDTATSPRCANNVVSGGAGYCVIAAADIVVTTNLRATGTKPLILIATGSITSDPGKSIDVSSHQVAGVPTLGAGHDPDTCSTAGGTAPANEGGGAGGSFLGKGGAGGNGNAANTGGGTSGNAVASVAALRGGCPGQDGQGTAGSGAHGGGAVFLIAGQKIDLKGPVFAGGQGGGGGPKAPNAGGGGGGGAGGMIGFDAPIVMSSDAIAANGGGGGEGGSAAAAGGNGNPGADSISPTVAAGGKNGTTSGGDGGAGSVTAAAGSGGDGQSGDGGGGGGGGGAGLIKAPANAQFATGKVSPDPTH